MGIFENGAALMREEWEAVLSWPAARSRAEVRRFQQDQPVVGSYIFAMLSDESLFAATVCLQLGDIIDRVYARSLGVARRITEEDMLAAAEHVDERFAELVGVGPDLVLRRLLQQRDLAVPEIVTEVVALLGETGENEPELEAALGGAFATMLAVATAYERAHGLEVDGVPKASLADAIEKVTGRPLQKVGRNEPCPCGSGRKFKKCCGQRLETPPPPPAKSHAEELFLEYLSVVETVWTALQQERGPDAHWVLNRSEEFERDYTPGQPDGVPDSMHVHDVLFDLVIPQRGKTFGELFLERNRVGLDEAERRRLRYLCASYTGFHEVIQLLPQSGQLRLRELITETEYAVSDIDDPKAEVDATGEIWLCRLAGPVNDAVTLMTPLVYPADARAELETLVRGLVAARMPGVAVTSKAVATVMKRSVIELAQYVIRTAPDEEEWELEDMDKEE